MITVNQSYQISGGLAPYAFTWTADLPCVMFAEGTSTGSSADGIVALSATFDTTTCLETAQVTLTWTDANGCTDFSIIGVDQACDNFTVSSISYTAPYTFSVTAGAPGCSAVEFVWNFDDTLFESNRSFTGPYSAQLNLELINNTGVLPASSLVSVTATDCNGCSTTTSTTFSFCQPNAQDFAAQMYCVTNEVTGQAEQFQSANVTIPQPTGCTGLEIDWATLSVGLPAGFVMVNNGDGTVQFQAVLTTSPGIYLVTYTVRTTDGIPSGTGQITLILSNCESGTTISIPNRVVSIDCSLDPGDILEINIEDWVITSPGVVVDWTSWALVEPPTANSPLISLTTNLEGDHVIEYTTTDPLAADIFAWTVCDSVGNCADAAVYTVIDCLPTPTAVDDDACATCGQATTILVLDNDLGNGAPFDITSIGVVSLPTNGTVSLPGDGTIIYTPSSTFTGEDQFTYQVSNVHGSVSNEATVTVAVICPGTDTVISVCQ